MLGNVIKFVLVVGVVGAVGLLASRFVATRRRRLVPTPPVDPQDSTEPTEVPDEYPPGPWDELLLKLPDDKRRQVKQFAAENGFDPNSMEGVTYGLRRVFEETGFPSGH